MSPSRIPRPGIPPSPLGPNSRKPSGVSSPSSPHLRSVSGPAAPGTPPSRLPQPVSPRIPSSPLNQTPQPVNAGKFSRRPRPQPPPSDDVIVPPSRLPEPIAPLSPRRRPVPPVEDTGIPRLSPAPRSCLRQPSTPNLASMRTHAMGMGNVSRPITDPQAQKPMLGRSRAESAAAVNVKELQTTAPTVPALRDRSSTSGRGTAQIERGRNRGYLGMDTNHLFDASFLDSREPTVPPHISVRLRLIHQLGVVLGLENKVIASKIDVPTLLAKVDAAYDKGHGGFSGCEGEAGSMRERHDCVVSGTEGKGTAGFVGARASGISGEGRNGRGMFRMLKRFSKRSQGLSDGASLPLLDTENTNDDGPVFGVALNDSPSASWCTSLIGGQKHDLPLVVFTVIEEIYRRGMSQPGIFRLAGDGPRLASLINSFNTPPTYGDNLPLATEPIHNLTGLIKRYVRDLPEPILDTSVFQAFQSFCAVSYFGDTMETGSDDTISAIASSVDTESTEPASPTLPTFPMSTRVTAAQILLNLLPPSHFSLCMYLLAFLGQLPLFPENRLNIDSISIIFGPAICAPRGKGISGLGPCPVRGSDASDTERIADLVNQSQVVLSWLLRNWPAISDKVLDPPCEDSSPLRKSGSQTGLFSSTPTLPCQPVTGITPQYDDRLLSPIDLRGHTDSASSSEDSPYAKDRIRPVSVLLTDHGSSSMSHLTVESQSPASVLQTPPDRLSSITASIAMPSNKSEKVSKPMGLPESPPSLPASSSTFGLGLFHRAKSSSNLSSQMQMNRGSLYEVSSPPMLDPSSSDNHGKAKRSASFTSLSSLLKRGSGVSKGKAERRQVPMVGSLSDPERRAGRTRSNTTATGFSASEQNVTPRSKPTTPLTSPQVHNVLDSLHDLLLSKDKQIERDARELAILRHTLLEMDEKLQRLATSPSRGGSYLSKLQAPPLSPPTSAPPPLRSSVPLSPNHSASSTASSSQPSAYSTDPSSPTPPSITITSTASSPSIPALISESILAQKERELAQMQEQLSTALASLESARARSRHGEKEMFELESRLARCESDRQLEINRVEVQLAIEQARVKGLVKERDVAIQRLDKVKSTLLSVS